jgi:hypothetical protein
MASSNRPQQQQLLLLLPLVHTVTQSVMAHDPHPAAAQTAVGLCNSTMLQLCLAASLSLRCSGCALITKHRHQT